MSITATIVTIVGLFALGMIALHWGDKLQRQLYDAWDAIQLEKINAARWEESYHAIRAKYHAAADELQSVQNANEALIQINRNLRADILKADSDRDQLRGEVLRLRTRIAELEAELAEESKES